MWITTTKGFLSAVIDGQKKGNMLLRFRTPEHAKAIRRLLEGKPPTIRETAAADYRWKFSISKARFTMLLITLGDEVTYSNFKGACAHAEEMSQHSDALHSAWSVWERVQRGITHPQPIRTYTPATPSLFKRGYSF